MFYYDHKDEQEEQSTLSSSLSTIHQRVNEFFSTGFPQKTTSAKRTKRSSSQFYRNNCRSLPVVKLLNLSRRISRVCSRGSYLGHFPASRGSRLIDGSSNSRRLDDTGWKVSEAD